MFEARTAAIAANGLKPVIDRVFGFDEVPAALRHMEAGAFRQDRHPRRVNGAAIRIVAIVTALVPAKAGTQFFGPFAWIPACAGMTGEVIEPPYSSLSW